MRGITEKPGQCCDCGKDLPRPRNNAKKRCDDCSHKRDLDRMAKWYEAHAEPRAKIRCEFQGGANLSEKYRKKYNPAAPCFGEFDRKNPREKYCDNCKPVARRWQQLKSALTNYHADRKKAAKRALKSRLKRRKADGRPVRVVLGHLYPCAYRKGRKRGEGCLGKFKATSSAQKFCAVCRKHADAEIARKSRKAHTLDIRLRDRLRSKARRDALAKLRAGKFVPVRQIEELTKTRISLAACLQIERVNPYGMAAYLYPAAPDLARQEEAADRTRRFDATKKFLRRRKGLIDAEQRRLVVLPEAERKAIREELSTQIHSLP